MDRELQIHPMTGNWKLPVNLAIGCHVLVALALVYLPQLFHQPLRPEEIYSVDLIQVTEPLISEAPATAEPTPESEARSAPAPEPAPTVPAVPDKPVEDAITLEEPKIVEPASVAETPPREAISIKPSKHKIKADPTPEPVTAKTPRTQREDISTLQRRKLAEMIRAQEKAAEEARILAEEAELEHRLAEAAARRRQAARARAAITASGQTGNTTTPSARLSILELQYFSAVRARIQPFWTLPKSRAWDRTLEARIVITIEKDGRIAGSFLEKSSGDTIFDRFAQKVLEDVGHLPPIPAALKKERLELGLKFSPGDIR